MYELYNVDMALVLAPEYEPSCHKKKKAEKFSPSKFKQYSHP